MRYPKLRELKEAVKALIKGPYTSRFPYEPHTPAKRFRGKPVPDDKECIGCGACAEVCPPGAIELKDVVDGSTLPTRFITWRYDVCIFCGQCERNCVTEKGVKLSNTEFDLATLDRTSLTSEIKKELVLCDCCKEVIAPKEQILWLVKKLGPKAYGNVLFLSSLQKELQIVEEIPEEKISPPLKRAHLFMIVCPKCRHNILVFDEFGKV